MKDLSFVAQRVTPSPIRQMFNLAQGMKDVISFTVGEPDFLTPDNIVDAAVRALKDGQHKYTPNAGIAPLREALCETEQKTAGLSYNSASECMVAAGGMEALLLAMLTILNPGDEFILTDPCWTNYSRQISICSAIPKFVAVDETTDFCFSPAKLEEAITPETKGFIINSPSNPTGGIAAEALLKELAEIAIRHDLWVISDEVYSRIAYEGEKPCSIAKISGMKERTVIVGSFSKTYAMTGWRVGYAFGPETIIQNMVKLQENVAACVNTAAQYGALEALTGNQDSVHRMTETYKKRRELVVDSFSEVPLLRCFAPQRAFYAFVNIEQTGMTSQAFAEDLLEKARVIVVPGHAFGKNGDNYIRLSFATSEENILNGIERIKKYIHRTFISAE